MGPLLCGTCTCAISFLAILIHSFVCFAICCDFLHKSGSRFFSSSLFVLFKHVIQSVFFCVCVCCCFVSISRCEKLKMMIIILFDIVKCSRNFWKFIKKIQHYKWYRTSVIFVQNTQWYLHNEYLCKLTIFVKWHLIIWSRHGII